MEHDTNEEREIDRLEDEPSPKAGKRKSAGSLGARKPKAAAAAPKPMQPKAQPMTCNACGISSAEAYFREGVARTGVCSQCRRMRDEIGERVFVEMYAQDSGADPHACAVLALQWGMAFARASQNRQIPAPPEEP